MRARDDNTLTAKRDDYLEKMSCGDGEVSLPRTRSKSPAALNVPPAGSIDVGHDTAALGAKLHTDWHTLMMPFSAATRRDSQTHSSALSPGAPYMPMVVV